jgi:hypothetical protein
MTELRRSLRHEAVRRERRYRLRGLTKRASLAAFAGLCRAIIRLIRNRDPDRTARAAGRLMRAIGPRLRGHHVARANLKAAFPEKSDQEIERVIDGVWDNLSSARIWPTGNCRHHSPERSASRSPGFTIPRVIPQRMTCSSRSEAGEPN